MKVCTDLSCEDFSFAQYFVIHELAYSVSKYNDLFLTAMRAIAEAWKGKLDSQSPTNEFRQLVARNWKEGERPSDILQQIRGTPGG
jgi:hypothetical protein